MPEQPKQPRRLTLNPTDRLEMAIGQSLGKHHLSLFIVNGSESICLDTKTFTSEEDVWLEVQKFAQSRLCDLAEAAERSGANVQL